MEQFSQASIAAFTLLGAAGIVFGLLSLIAKRRGFGAAVMRSRREFLTNLGLALVNLIVLAPLFAVPGGALRSAIGAPEIFVDFWAGVPDLAALVAAVLIYDFVVYWRHRMEHSRLLWPIHATHHADVTLHWLTAFRKHPLSKLLSVCVDVALLLWLGLPEWAIGGAGLVLGWWAFFVHVDEPWTLGIFGKILISPAAHRLHHIRDETLMGTNYGNTLTLWDRAFGTYVDPRPHLDCETGIAEGTRNLGGELLRPFERRYWRRATDVPVEVKATV